MRRYFWLNRETLQNKHFQYFDRSKTRHDRAKIGLAGQHDRPPFKNYFEPCLGVSTVGGVSASIITKMFHLTINFHVQRDYENLSSMLL